MLNFTFMADILIVTCMVFANSLNQFWNCV